MREAVKKKAGYLYKLLENTLKLQGLLSKQIIFKVIQIHRNILIYQCIPNSDIINL